MVLWDGLRIEGFTTDGITAPERLQETETEVGSDGFVVVTRASANAEIVTLTLYPNSPGYRILSETFSQEQSERGSLPVHTYHQENSITGDVMSDPTAILLQGPLLGEGVAGPREFKILLPDPVKRYAENIVA